MKEKTYLEDFIQTPLTDYIEKIKNKYSDKLWFKWNETFSLKKDNDLTELFFKDLVYRTKLPDKQAKFFRPQRNVVILLYSTNKSGTGKSTVSIEIAWRINKQNYPSMTGKQFVEECVHFTIEDLIKAIEQNEKEQKKGLCHIYDESRLSSSIGVGSATIQKKIVDTVNICREFGLSIIQIVQKRSYGRIITPHYIINVNKINFQTQENVSIIETDDYEQIGHVITKKTVNEELFEEYNKKKTAFINNTLKGLQESRATYYETLAKKLMENKDYNLCETKDEKIIQAMIVLGSELPKTLISLLIARADFLKRKRNNP